MVMRAHGISIGKNRARFLSPLLPYASLVAFAYLVPAAQGDEILRVPLNDNAVICVRAAQHIFLEITMPREELRAKFLAQYLSDREEVKRYQKTTAAAIPYLRLAPAVRRQVLEALFPDDGVDGEGWWHVVDFDAALGERRWEIWALWFTQDPNNAERIRSASKNADATTEVGRGQTILVPLSLLPEVFRKPKPRRKSESTASNETATDTNGNGNGNPYAKELRYGEDKEGKYAAYRLKRGEAMYSDVVVRFTDFQDNSSIHEAIRIITKRSGIADPNRVKAGEWVKIPLSLLSDKYQPQGSEQRQEYEAVRQEAKRLKGERSPVKGLKGVVIILDAGHGGRDHGAAVESEGLYEDELAYDIMCRLKRILEEKTQAKVYVTTLDTVQKYEPTDKRRFEHDTHEVVLTTPPYPGEDARVSARLRYYLANDIYRREKKNGINEKNILFLSIHCDSLFDERLRGAMVYIPGAQYRRESEGVNGNGYDGYREVRGGRIVKTTPQERRRDEALSRNFAETVVKQLKKHNPSIVVHSAGDPIRNVIRQDGGKAYVPAVLRNTLVPTKVLVEVANLTNAADRACLSDPVWRQAFAEALCASIREHFE